MSKPKISVNKLGEFVGATHLRQRGIVKDQAAKRPPGVKTFRYTEARAACSRYFIGGFDESILDATIKKLNNKSILNDHDANDQKTSIESLNTLKLLDLSMFAGFEFQPFTGDGIIDIAGVDVKVYPDLILRGEIKKKKLIGAIKIHLGKTDPLNSRSQNVVATILNSFIDTKVKSEQESSSHKLMFSIDVFGKSVHPAPKAQTQILANVEAACEVYKLLWRSIKEPLS